MIELYTVVCHKGYLGITCPYKPDRTLYRGLSQRLSRYYLSIQTWQNSIPWSVTKAISALLVHTNLRELYTMVCHKGYLGITGPDKPDRTLYHGLSQRLYLGITGPDKPDRTLYRGLSQRLSWYYWSIPTWQNSIPWSVTKVISVLLVHTNLIELYIVVCHKGYLGITGQYQPDRTLYRGLSQRLSQYYWSIPTW